MNYLTSVTNSSLAQKIRTVVARLFGPEDVKSAQESGPFGFDGGVLPGLTAVYIKTNKKSGPVFIGYVLTNQLALPGEARMYSTDAGGSEKARIWCHNNGDVELGGTGAAGSNVNHGVQWEALNTSLASTVNQINANFTVLYGALGITPVPPVPFDISTAKLTKIKVE